MKEDDFYKEFGFTMACKLSGAINFEELVEWVFLKIGTCKSLPAYAYVLTDAKDLSEFDDIIGDNRWKLRYGLNNSESRALKGIAYKRGRFTKENPSDVCTEKTALKNLGKNPHILQRFRETFPFIKLDWID